MRVEEEDVSEIYLSVQRPPFCAADFLGTTKSSVARLMTIPSSIRKELNGEEGNGDQANFKLNRRPQPGLGLQNSAYISGILLCLGVESSPERTTTRRSSPFLTPTTTSCSLNDH